MKSLPEEEDPINLVKLTKAFSKDPAARNKDAFAARDRIEITTPPKDNGWYGTSLPAQRRELQRMAGTYRPPGGVRALTRKRSRGNLRERDYVVELGAALIKAGESKRGVEHGAPRWCLLPGCGVLIGPERRSMARFCCDDHRVTFFRANKQRNADFLAEWAKGRVREELNDDWSDLVPDLFEEPAPPTMSVMYAVRSGQLKAFMAARKRTLVTDSTELPQ